ncbi:MAG: trypsin-like peptidase domain-containing protein [Acidimicrobiales bacterium]
MTDFPPDDQVPVADSLPPHPPSMFSGRPPDLPPVPGADPPAGRPRRWRLPLAIVAGLALLVGAFAGGWALNRGDDSGNDAASAAANRSSSIQVAADVEDRPTEPPLDSSDEEPAAAVADAVAPAVVQIETAQGLGSGVIYDPDGLILTAAHVVAGSEHVTLRLADGTTRDGTVVGTDTDSDIGVVSIDGGGDGLPVAVLADSPPDVGDLAVAVGSPYALDQTVTAGIVSALDRPAPSGGPSVGTIQTDAPINPGNSGGPLANREGEVIGIASYIQSETGGNVGLGFAVPVDIAVRVADAIVAGEPVEFGYLGIEGGDAAGSDPGALLASIVPGSPAEDAGLQAGDRIVAVDGDAVTSFGDFGVIIRRHGPGDELALTVARNGEEQEITVTVGSTAD